MPEEGPESTPGRASGDAEAALWRWIVEQAPDAMIFVDGSGAIRVWNRGAEAMFGYSAAEILGCSVDIIIPERLRHAHGEGFRKAMDAGRTKYAGQVLTTRSVRRNGDRLYVDLSFSLVRDDAGTVTGALAIARDCTARRQADNALQARAVELEKRLRAAGLDAS